MLKSLAGGILSILAIFIVIGLFLPSNYEIEAKITIESSVEKSFTKINTLKSWEQWAFEDSSAIADLNYEGPTDGLGAIYTWHDDYSTGRMEIVESIPNESIKLKLISDYGESETSLQFLFNDLGTNHQIKWIQSGDVGYDLRLRFFILLGGLDKTIGEQNQKSLERLKKSVTQ